MRGFPVASNAPFALCTALLLSLFLCTVVASPFSPLTNDTLFSGSPDVLLHRRDDAWLRIMPLGASITAGDFDPPDDQSGNGYRKPLRDQLRADGWNVNMVGQFQRGNMSDRDHEGHSGDRVSQVALRASDSIPRYKPNVILLNAGTNDATQNNKNEPAATAHTRLMSLVESIFAMVPDAVVVLSTLIPNKDAPDNVDMINKNYRVVANQFISDGRHVVLAEMNDGKYITEDLIHDTTHPTYEGRRRMAAVWYHAINKASAAGWIKEPETIPGQPDDGVTSTCEKSYGSGNNNGRGGEQVLAAANSLISDDGSYRHASKERDTITINSLKDDSRFVFAQITKLDPSAEWYEALDDLVQMSTLGNGRRTLAVFKNSGGGSLGVGTEFYVANDCAVPGIAWGDVDGDGYDDFLCVTERGEVWYSRNLQKDPPEFGEARQIRAVTHGYSRRHVRFGDIDGDGRVDYCLVGDDGNIRCWRNGGPGEMPKRWQDMGQGRPVFTAKGLGDIRGVRFVDINGDGRADWIWLDKSGKSTIYINQRDGNKGMIPRWTLASSSHGGGFPTTDGGTREQIIFGRLYQSGRADYMFIERKDCRIGYCDLVIRPYENLGGGGRFQKGDGAYWGDMRGRGLDDYIWISPDGVINVFPNQNTKEDTTRDVTRGIWGGVIRALETGRDRRALHIGDWDGDGMDDIIAVDKWSGKLTIWITSWDGNQFTFDRRQVNNENLCKQGWGVGYFDNGHHFADISGDGRVDYLCMEPNGRVTGWINHGSDTLMDNGQIKFSEGLDRANWRFADVNGDGKADLLWLDKFTGNARVWKNVEWLPGNDRVSGSKFRWDHKGFLYQGSSRGPNMHFPSLGGQGRADMVQVDPTTAHGWVWFNTCSAGGDDSWQGPKLPDYGEIIVDPGDGGSSDVGDEKFCGGKAASWDSALWREMEMSLWLQDRLNVYASGPEWPVTSEGSKNGIPQVLSEFEFYDKDNRWTWPATCAGVTLTCNFADETVTSGTKCATHSRRAFAIWAAKNYALFLHTHYNSMVVNGLVGNLQLGSMATDFRADDAAADVNVSAWLTIMNGILGTLGAIPFGPASAGLSVLSGLAGMGGGIASLVADSPDYEPTFKAWAELSKGFGDSLKRAMGAFSSYYSLTLASRPPPGDHEAVDALMKAIGDGAFASYNNGPVAFDPVVQAKMLTASIVSAMWNQQQVFAVRWTGGMTIQNTYILDACGGELEPFFKDFTYCVDGVNYMMLRWTDVSEMFTGDWGRDRDTLDNYDFTPEEVLKSAWETQERLKTFGSSRPDVFTRLADAVVSGGEDPSAEMFIQWTIPVCDYDSLEDIEPPGCSALGCLSWKVRRMCQEMYYSETEGWPYSFS